MNYNTLPTQERLVELFDYDKETGILIRKDTATTFDRHSQPSARYLLVSVDGVSYTAQRLIWKLVTGAEPLGVIDHKNEDKKDNSFNNLQDITFSENLRRSKKRGRGFHKEGGKYVARPRYNGIRYYLGRFFTEQEAQQAVKEWRETYAAAG